MIQDWIISKVGVARNVSNIQPMWLFSPRWSANFLSLSDFRWDEAKEPQLHPTKSRTRTQERQMFRFPHPHNAPDINEFFGHLIMETNDYHLHNHTSKTFKQQTVVKWIAFHSSWPSMSHPDTLLTVNVIWLQVLTVRKMTEANIKDWNAHLTVC